ncbi:hypothetical protein XENOCAPTIV_000976, partial [Xenoophorus captivus]
VIYELPTTNQWCFDVQWCPRNPALLSTASFDGRITVYSVMGGSLKAQQQSTADMSYCVVAVKTFCSCRFQNVLGRIFNPTAMELMPKILQRRCSVSQLRSAVLHNYTDGLISQALLVGNFEGAVDLCLNDGRYAEAILLSISGGEDLLKKTQQKYLSKQKNSISMDLVEKVMMLRKSIERLRNSEVAVQSPILAEKLTCYAGILAAEGSLATAMTYLPDNSDQGEAAARQQAPNSFNRVGVPTANPMPAAKAPIIVEINL